MGGLIFLHNVLVVEIIVFYFTAVPSLVFLTEMNSFENSKLQGAIWKNNYILASLQPTF